MHGTQRIAKLSSLRLLTQRYGVYSSSSWNRAQELIQLRIWDVENKRKQKTVIVVKSRERGARTKVLACGYSPDGGIIGGGTLLHVQSYMIFANSLTVLLLSLS